MTFGFNNLSFEFISLILRDFSLSSRSFYLEKGTLAFPFDKNPKNLRELSYENKQNKLKTQVNMKNLLKVSYEKNALLFIVLDLK